MSDEQRSKFNKRRGEAADRLGFKLDGTQPPTQGLGTVEAKHVVGKGLGTFAARDIKMGETIMISKPLVHADHALDRQWKYYYRPDRAKLQKSTACWLAVAKAIHDAAQGAYSIEYIVL